MQGDDCLRGLPDVFPMLEGRLDRLLPLPTRSVRVFLSSTFSGDRLIFCRPTTQLEMVSDLPLPGSPRTRKLAISNRSRSASYDRVKPKNRPGWHVKIALDITTVLRCDVQQWVQTTRYRQSVMIISNGWRMPSSAEPRGRTESTARDESQWEGIPVSNGLRKK